MKVNKQQANLGRSDTVEEVPLACCDETAAVEFFEKRLWKGTPTCAHCKSTNVYQMKDAKTGERNKRFIWRCHDCKKQFTVRVGTVLEESRIPLRHWAYAFWRAATSKKGVSALEIKRHTQLSYKSALFLMHRIRFALACKPQGKMSGTVEVDETYVGGKPRPENKQVRGTSSHRQYSKQTSDKVPVVAVIERGGDVRARVMTRVTERNITRLAKQAIDMQSTVNTDGFAMYHNIFYDWKKHDVVNHSAREYARLNKDGTVAHVNSCESFFAVMKRGLHGIYHAVSKEHLHRYCAEFEFRWNTRGMNDGDRTDAAIQNAAGKRLSYEECVA